MEKINLTNWKVSSSIADISAQGEAYFRDSENLKNGFHVYYNGEVITIKFNGNEIDRNMIYLGELIWQESNSYYQIKDKLESLIVSYNSKLWYLTEWVGLRSKWLDAFGAAWLI